jgi:hypothetical protein
MQTVTVEDGLNPRSESRMRQQEREIIDKGFEIVPMKFCSSAESEERRSSIVNVGAAFQS